VIDWLMWERTTVLILLLIPDGVRAGVLGWLLLVPRSSSAAAEHLLEELELRGRGEDEEEEGC